MLLKPQMRNRRFTRVWREAIRETQQLEDEHKRKHPMVYGWSSNRFYSPRYRHVPMLAYEWRNEMDLRRETFSARASNEQ